jgi:hypothetical protein
MSHHLLRLSTRQRLTLDLKEGSMQSKTRAIVTVLIIGVMAGCSTGPVTKDEGDALLMSAQASRKECIYIDQQF